MVKDRRLLVLDNVYFGRLIPTFRRNLLLPSFTLNMGKEFPVGTCLPKYAKSHCWYHQKKFESKTATQELRRRVVNIAGSER